MNRIGVERDDHNQGIARLDGTVVPAQDDGAAGLGVDRRGRAGFDRVDFAQFGAGVHGVPQSDVGGKDSSVRRGMVRLQMGFFGVGRLEKWLNRQHGFGPVDTPEFDQQVLQTAIQSGEVFGQDFARTATFGVDGGDLAVERCTEGASGQERSRPAPIGIKASRHGTLGGIQRGATAGDVADPRMQFESMTAAVQIDVVRRMREEFGVEEVRETGGGRALRGTGKCPGKVSIVDGMTTLPRRKRGFVQHGHDDDGAVQVGRSPRFYPLAQDRGAFVFVAMRCGVDDHDGTGGAAPDPRVETEGRGSESILMATGGKCGPVCRFGRKRRLRHG